MTDLFSELTGDHRLLLRLCTELTGGSGVPEGPPTQRKATSERLVTLAAQHEVAEERVLWPVVRKRVWDGDELAGKALHQEGGVKRLLHDLHHTSAGSSEFATMVRRLASALREHVTLEESQAFPRLRLQLSEEDSERLGVELAHARAAAPSRVHPDTGAAPGRAVDGRSSVGGDRPGPRHGDPPAPGCLP